MNLFGCKFCDPETGVCDRKNFDSLLWATVTVFQVWTYEEYVIHRIHSWAFLKVLTQEDWNIVLFAGMERTSHWAALYFVALMTFGNYVLFNLLVAILVEGFSNQVKINLTLIGKVSLVGSFKVIIILNVICIINLCTICAVTNFVNVFDLNETNTTNFLI